MSCDRRSPVDKTCLLENSSLAECWEYVVAPVPVQVPRVRVQQCVKKPIMLMALIMQGHQKHIHASNYKHVWLVGGFNPSEKYDRQIGSFPQGSG